MSSSATMRMSESRATWWAITSTDGRQPFGKISVFMNERAAFSASYSRSSIVMACSAIAPSGRSSAAQRAKNVPKSLQPTASIISIDTSLS